MKIDANATCSARELAQLFGCTDRAVRLLVDRGAVVRVSRGRYRLVESVRRTIEHYREVAAGRGGAEGMLDLSTERARLAKAQTEQVELKNAASRGELAPLADYREAWTGILRGVRQFVLSLPGRIAFEVSVLTAGDRVVIERICNDGLADASLGRGFDVAGGEHEGDVP
jgi:terminase small subunit / prophage DNA-packing protein